MIFFSVRNMPILTYTVDWCIYFTHCPLIYDWFLVIREKYTYFRLIYYAYIMMYRRRLSSNVLHITNSWVLRVSPWFPFLILTQAHVFGTWRSSGGNLITLFLCGWWGEELFLVFTSAFKCVEALSSWQGSTACDFYCFHAQTQWPLVAWGWGWPHPREQRLLTSGQRWCIRITQTGCVAVTVRLDWNTEV